jgi:DNA-binding HxlR family transcriptional regulator
LILKALFDGNMRFGELRKALHNITSKTLSEKLKKLEEHDILDRTVYPTVPPAVEYRLTEKGRSLWPIIIQMKHWGAKWG